MKRSRLPFDHHPQEQRGVLFLLVLIFLIQVSYWAWMHYSPPEVTEVQTQAFARDTIPERRYQPKPFNPNFISDYKGYLLGLSPDEVDRLHAYRDSGAWIRSAAQFQEVTGVGDSLLEAISPYFKFPDLKPPREQKIPLVRVIDLNKATAAQLREVYGVGPVLSERIVRFREALGGFVSDIQLADVYGLDQEVAHRILQRFRVLEAARPERIHINQASREELSALAYIRWALADAIVDHRERHGPYEKLEDLTAVPGFPLEKIDRIGLYLEF